MGNQAEEEASKRLVEEEAALKQSEQKACEATGTLKLCFDAPYDKIDKASFKNELLEAFCNLDIGEATLKKITISLHRGSVIAVIEGPAPAVQELYRKPLETMTVMGYKALLHPDAENALVVRAC